MINPDPEDYRTGSLFLKASETPAAEEGWWGDAGKSRESLGGFSLPEQGVFPREEATEITNGALIEWIDQPKLRYCE
jgi:hypothetical protein